MRIRQNSVFLGQLVKEVSRGIMVPAAFQRPYVWTEQDVLAMCNSIIAGYPLGGFLTWEPARSENLDKVARSRLGPIVPAADAPVQKLLLDGQNRLATVAWMLRDDENVTPEGLSDSERATWASGKRLVIDLEHRCMQFVPEAEAAKGFRLPAKAAFGSHEVNRLVRERWDTTWKAYAEAQVEAGLQWFDRQLQDAFRDARVVETLLENATAAEAKRAFLHICKVGVPMSEEDFDRAAAWTLAG